MAVFADFSGTFFTLWSKKINVFEREFMYVKIFHKCFINFVIGTKENLQKAPGLRWILC